ncbi:MAG TPA: peptidase S8, partial [Chloroflexi bacterium]|nr:peptidase S8 [Chloroflexota bacterium]
AIEPSKQWHPDVTPRLNDLDTYPSIGIHIAWADGRNYDDWNYDIFLANTCQPINVSPEEKLWPSPPPPCNSACEEKICEPVPIFEGCPEGSTVQVCFCTQFNIENICNSYGNYSVNDNVKIQPFLDEDYIKYSPAAARQYRPAITRAITREIWGGPCGCRIEAPYVVWDDNRYTDPLSGGQGDRDIFFTRPLITDTGTYISPIIDAGAKAKWYYLEWWGVTPLGTKITFQTRTGDTPWPDDSWTEWTGPKYDPEIGKWVYDGPAEIVDPNCNLYPESRYIQYRIDLRCCPDCGFPCNVPCISAVKIYYEGGLSPVYLPLILKNYSEVTPPPTSITPNDSYYETYQWNLRRINAPSAWGITTGNDTIIAILDTGVDTGHPDLAAKIVNGYDFVNGDSDPSDDNGHGTHVAGIAAAVSNNGIGIAGVSWGARIMPVKVMDADGEGSHYDIANGIIWAANNGARIINLSLGSQASSQTLQNAVNEAYTKGCLLVAAAGNYYQEGNPVIYPAAYPNVLAVAATGYNDEHASYSEAGDYVDVAAPGGNPESDADTDPNHWIMSTFWRGKGYGDYLWMAGTSQAAPHVAGLAALVWTVNPSLSNDGVASVITSSAVDIGDLGKDDFFGYGRIDAYAAVKMGQTSSVTQRWEKPFRPQPNEGSLPHRPGYVLVRFLPYVTQAEVDELLRDLGATVVDEIPALRVKRLRVPEGRELDVISALEASSRVEYAEPDYLAYAF